MAFKIGFATEELEKKTPELTQEAEKVKVTPRKSVVQVYFSKRDMTLAYYNDMFDLHRGDIVYVDGKLEGMRGRVTDVNYNFKIKISDYKRVIALVDTTVKGKFFMAGSHFLSFDKNTLPSSKVLLWFKAPETEDIEVVSGSDDTSFSLDNIGSMNVSPAIIDRGHDYYIRNKVRYISLDGIKGYAIVEGNEVYEVEFEYRDGQVGGLVCSCFYANNCKHEVAAMFQLKETIEHISEHYADEYNSTGYFAAIEKGTFFAFAIDGKDKGTFTL